MANFPSIEYTADSNVEFQDGRIMERSEDGTLHGRVNYDSAKRIWSLRFLVSPTDAETLRDHYEAHLEATFSFTDQERDSAHTVAYLTPPAWNYLDSSNVRVAVSLAEV